MMLFFVGLLTGAIGNFMSNTTSSLLVAPIVKAILQDGTYRPFSKAFVLTLVGCSQASNATPISTPMNLIAQAALGYTWAEFFRFGFPLQILQVVFIVLFCYVSYTDESAAPLGPAPQVNMTSEEVGL